MIKKLLLTIIVLFTSVFLLMGGRSLIESRIARWTTDFNILPSDSRILYEDGAEKVADEVSRNLNNAMRTVESRQFGKINDPVKVYAFASPKSFSKFSGISDKARGASVDNEIYLSGLMLELPGEVYGMVCHELSHVQLTQILGVLSYNRTIPRWFREGLAIYVSDGGGAPRNHEKETIDMFLEGKHFVPVVEGNLINRSFKTTSPIGPRMLYSQSGMFVKYLANTYPDNFQKFLSGIQKKKQFEENFNESFEKSAADIFQSYIKALRSS